MVGWATLGVAIATLAVASVGILVAFVQLRKTARASGAEALSLALAPLDDREIRETRYRVLSEECPVYPPLEQKWWGSDTERRVRRLLYA